MEGGYFLQGHSEFKGPMATPRDHRLWFDSNARSTPYDAFNSMEKLTREGDVDGDTWSWTGERRWAAKP